MKQANSVRNGAGGMQSSSVNAGLWMLLSVAAIAVSIGCYAVYNLIFSSSLARSAVEELDELLLQEDNSDSKLFALKLSQERSSTKQYLMLAIVSLVVLSLCVVYYRTSAKHDEGIEVQREIAFCKLYDHSHNLEDQLQVSDFETQTDNLRHQADKDSLRHCHQQKLLIEEKHHLEEAANQKDIYNKELNSLHFKEREAEQQVEDLKQERRRLENQLQHERSQGGKLKAELSEQAKGYEDKLLQQSRYHGHKEQEWEEQKNFLEHETAKLRNEVEQLEQHAKEWEEQCVRNKHEFEHRLKMCQKEWEQKERELNEQKQECAANIKIEQERSKLELAKQSAHFDLEMDNLQKSMSESLDEETKRHTEERDRLESEMLQHQKGFIQREKELKAVEANLTDELEWVRKKHNQERMKLEAEVQDLQQQLSQKDTGMKAAGSMWPFSRGQRKKSTAPPTHSSNGATASPPTDDDMR